MLKRLIFIVALIVLGITVIRVDVTRAQDLALQDVSGMTGEIVGVGLVLSNNTNVASVDAFIRIADGAVAEFVIIDQGTGEAMVEAGSALTPDQTAFGNVQPDGRLQLRVINFNPNVDPVPFNNGTLALISFLVTGQEGESTDLILENVECADDFAVVVPCNLTDGSITVAVGPIGEVNVTINKTSDTTRVDPGVPVLITYNIELNSIGDEDARDVNVTDTLPAGSDFQPGDSSPECEIVLGIPNTVGCVVGTIPSGQERVLNITISITREQGDDILNQAIVGFLNAIGDPVENQSNTFTIRVGGGGNGGNGCSMATGTVSGIGAVGSFAVLLIPAFAIGMRRLRRKISK